MCQASCWEEGAAFTMGHPAPDSANQGTQQSPRANVASSRQVDVAGRCRSGPERCQQVSKTLWSDLRR